MPLTPGEQRARNDLNDALEEAGDVYRRVRRLAAGGPNITLVGSELTEVRRLASARRQRRGRVG